MRIAIVSDPHGDLVALSAVIADLERQGGVDETLVAGDLAQGGPEPAAVVDEIRRRGWPSVRGNGDDFLVRIARGEPLHPGEPEALVSRGAWSVDQLGAERLEHLRSLPLALERDGFPFGRLVLVHATPWSDEDVVLPDAEEAVARRMVEEARAGLLAYGHIHCSVAERLAAFDRAGSI